MSVCKSDKQQCSTLLKTHSENNEKMKSSTIEMLQNSLIINKNTIYVCAVSQKLFEEITEEHVKLPEYSQK